MKISIVVTLIFLTSVTLPGAIGRPATTQTRRPNIDFVLIDCLAGPVPRTEAREPET